jgi:hypothetical protein
MVAANLDQAGVVRRRLRTHAALADLSPTALPTLRVIVCLDEQGEPEPTHAFLRLGPIGSALDNFSAGGISAAADLATGILAEARIRHGRGGRVDRIGRHPGTGAAIEGREVPLFRAAVALAAEAHRRLFGGRRVLIGWDVALSEVGAMLIEGQLEPRLAIAPVGQRDGHRRAPARRPDDLPPAAPAGFRLRLGAGGDADARRPCPPGAGASSAVKLPLASLQAAPLGAFRGNGYGAPQSTRSNPE